MSGAAEYFDELERDREETMVLTEDKLTLLDDLLSLSLFATPVAAY